jgi:hypothetical protein
VIDDEQARALAGRWLEWVQSIPSETSPVTDATGEHAGLNQPDDVWFLAGCMGGAVQRRCVVPAGRPLFFPLFNQWGRSKDLVSPQATGSVVLDGEWLTGQVVHNDEPIKIPLIAGRNFPRIKVRMWGLWRYQPGLDAGEHALEFHGSQQPGGFWVKARYGLTSA